MAEFRYYDLGRTFRDAADDGRQRAQQNKLASLYSQAWNAPKEQQGSYLAQMAGIDPRAATGMEGQFQKRKQSQQEAAIGLARAWQTTQGRSPQEREAFYNGFIVPKAQEAGLPLPQAFDADAFDREAGALVAMGGGGQGLGVQSTYVDAQGNRVAIMRDGTTAVLGQNAPNNQIIDTGNGFYGVNKGTLSAAPVTIGGAPQAGAPAPNIAPGNYQTPAGMVRVGDLTPDEQQAMLADIQAGGNATNVQLPQREVSPPQFGGPQLRSAPKPQAPSELDRRIAAARAMGATDDEIRRMVIGREGAAAGAKPLPVGALRELLDVEDSLGGARNLSAIITKHASRMVDGKLTVGPVDTWGAKFRTATNSTTDNDVNLNEWSADKTRIVNESLRLNKGVQTEGDAQRAAQELMAATDNKTAARALRRLAEYNTRAVELQKRRQALVRKNYGQDEAGNPIGAQPVIPQAATNAVLRYNPATGDFD